MKCERCGIKGVRLHELRVTYESGNGRIYSLCMDCTHDILDFIDLPPDFNCHGYNLNFFEQSKKCDTRYNRGYATEERQAMYRECERLKRMDVHIMYHEVGEYIFEYQEVSDRQGIAQYEKGVLVYHYSIAEPMSRQTFEKFCEEVVEKENNRGMDIKQSDKT